MKKIFFIVLTFVLYLFFIAPSAFAEEINSFDVSLTAHKDGSMDVVENIQYDFGYSSRHGIYRDIPLFSKVGDLYRIIKIQNVLIERDGKKEKFETTNSKEKISFKIGNANKTITGEHLYKISYTVQNGIGSNFPDYDEIYWNATGNEWEATINKASLKINSDFNIKPTNYICYEGAYGGKDKSCSINKGVISSGQILYPGYGLTGVAVFPKGTFPPSVLYKELPKTTSEKIGETFLKNIWLIFLFINLVLPIVLMIWYEKKKNKKRFGPPSVNFDIPKDEFGKRIAPAISGTIDSAKLERDDVVATIFDLAIRKYIKLEEIKIKKQLRPDKVEQKITKLKERDKTFSKFEERVFDRLFEDGQSVLAEDLKKDFYKTFQSMEDDIFKELVDKKYYFKNPKIQKGLLVVLGMIALFSGGFILGIVLIYLSRKLIGRTALGDEIDFKIDGLKLFLKSMDRNYEWQAKKFYTVEQMIPYAMALGYIDKFMDQLKIIKPDYNPTWYSGYHGNFYLSYGAFYSSVSSNMTTSAPSSSSGSSGGFSGGGGGGGGGGSW